MQGAVKPLESNPTLKPLLDLQATRVADHPKALEAYKKSEPELLAKYEEAVEKAKVAGTPAPRKPQVNEAPISGSMNEPDPSLGSHRR